MLITLLGIDNPVASLRNYLSLYSNHGLPGIDTEALEVFTIGSKSEKIKWEGCGLILNIPEGAVAEDGPSKTLQIQLGVGFGGQISLPYDNDLLSGVYSLTINGGTLSKPIKAEVQHCGAQLSRKHDNNMLEFLTANMARSTNLPYKMIPQHENTSFSCMSTKGTIDLPQLKKEEQGVLFTVCPISRDVLSRYCVRIFYHKLSVHTNPLVQDWFAHITITKDLDVCCLLYTSPSPRDATLSRMPSSA